METRMHVVFYGAMLALIPAVSLGFVALILVQNYEKGLIIGTVAAFCGGALGFYVNSRWRKQLSRREASFTALYAWVFFCFLYFWAYPQFSTAHYFFLSDAIFQIKVYGISLLLIVIASVIGYRLGRKDASSPSTAESRGVLAFIVPFLIVIILSAFVMRSGYQGQARANLRAARGALKNLAMIQESYFADHETYTKNQADLKKYGLKIGPGISVKILAAGVKSWSAVSSHESSDAVFTYSSSAGGLQ